MVGPKFHFEIGQRSFAAAGIAVPALAKNARTGHPTVLDAQQIKSLGHPPIVVGVGRGLAVLVGRRGAAATRVIGEAHRRAVGIGDPGQAVHDVVREAGGMR